MNRGVIRLRRVTFVDIAPADRTAVEAVWASYVGDSGYAGPLVTAYAFGDSADLAVLDGDGDGRPLAVVRTTDVRVGPLSSVDDSFAWDEGEGDRTRAWWLDGHTRFFTRQCAALGLTFSDDIGVVFERFELVWPTTGT